MIAVHCVKCRGRVRLSTVATGPGHAHEYVCLGCDRFEWECRCTSGPLRVVLSREDEILGATCAKERMERVRALGLESRAREVPGDNPMRNHLIGALGEVAFSKWLGIPFVCRIDSFHSEGDVLAYEVRTSTRPYTKVKGESAGEGEDPDDRIVVGVRLVGTVTFEMLGWIVARDAKRAEWLRDPGGRGAAYWVPRESMNPMDTLPR